MEPISFLHGSVDAYLINILLNPFFIEWNCPWGWKYCRRSGLWSRFHKGNFCLLCLAGQNQLVAYIYPWWGGPHVVLVLEYLSLYSGFDLYYSWCTHFSSYVYCNSPVWHIFIFLIYFFYDFVYFLSTTDILYYWFYHEEYPMVAVAAFKHVSVLIYILKRGI